MSASSQSKSLVDGVGKRLVEWLVAGSGSPCRLCWQENEDFFSLHDVVFEKEGPSLRDVLATVLPNTQLLDAVLPDSVCAACVSAVLAAYGLQRRCVDAANKLRDTLRALQDCTNALQPNPNPKVKAVYLNMGLSSPILSTSSNEVLHRCDSNDQQFARVEALRKHITNSDQTLICEICQRSYPSPARLAAHRTRAHAKKVHPCLDCGKNFGSPALVEEHRRAMHARLSCELCGLAFSSKHALRAHRLAHGKRLPCDKCGRSFKYKEGLKRHSQQCGHPRAILQHHACAQCGRLYSSVYTLAQHERYVHGDTPHVCEHCGKRFPDRGKLKCHESAHTGVNRYPCTICGARFRYPNTLLYHSRAMHTGERPYKCELCPQEFVSSGARTAHARRYHGAPGPACALCDRSFATGTHLRRHVASHNLVNNKI